MTNHPGPPGEQSPLVGSSPRQRPSPKSTTPARRTDRRALPRRLGDGRVGLGALDFFQNSADRSDRRRDLRLLRTVCRGQGTNHFLLAAAAAHPRGGGRLGRPDRFRDARGRKAIRRPSPASSDYGAYRVWPHNARASAGHDRFGEILRRRAARGAARGGVEPARRDDGAIGRRFLD